MWQHKASSHPMQTIEYVPDTHADLVHPVHGIPSLPQPPRQEPPPAAGLRDVRAMRREFARALDGNEFSLRFQPRYRIAAPRLTGIEGVIRWQHRRRGLIPEPLLMGLAEKARCASDVQCWAIGEGMQVLSHLPRGLRFALNLSPSLLCGAALFECVGKTLDRFGLAPEQLELSVNETVLAELDETALMVLATLFDDGVTIALGQFGARLGSLNLLGRIPLDWVKLDPGLVRGLPDDPGSIAMVRAATEVAHSLGARVVAMGVETDEQRKALAKLRCDELQGGIAGAALMARELDRLAR